MSPHLQRNATNTKRVSSLFSITSALLFHSFAQERKPTPFSSVACALFAKTAGVYPFARPELQRAAVCSEHFQRLTPVANFRRQNHLGENPRSSIILSLSTQYK